MLQAPQARRSPVKDGKGDEVMRIGTQKGKTREGKNKEQKKKKRVRKREKERDGQAQDISSYRHGARILFSDISTFV